VDPPRHHRIVQVAADAVPVGRRVAHLPVVLDGGLHREEARRQRVQRHHVALVQRIEPAAHRVGSGVAERRQRTPDRPQPQWRAHRHQQRHAPPPRRRLLPQQVVGDDAPQRVRHDHRLLSGDEGLPHALVDRSADPHVVQVEVHVPGDQRDGGAAGAGDEAVDRPQPAPHQPQILDALLHEVAPLLVHLLKLLGGDVVLGQDLAHDVLQELPLGRARARPLHHHVRRPLRTADQVE
jgi:hypothetical protein